MNVKGLQKFLLLISDHRPNILTHAETEDLRRIEDTWLLGRHRLPCQQRLITSLSVPGMLVTSLPSLVERLCNHASRTPSNCQ